MELAAWLAIAAGAGAVIGVEGWAWMRHGTSAIVVIVSGAGALVAGLIVVALVGSIAFGMLAGVTGIDPLGLNESAAQPTTDESDRCDPNYEGECLDPDSYDYDCEGGSGDGPQYAGLVEVVGDDTYGLDRDGDGTGCD